MLQPKSAINIIFMLPQLLDAAMTAEQHARDSPQILSHLENVGTSNLSSIYTRTHPRMSSVPSVTAYIDYI